LCARHAASACSASCARVSAKTSESNDDAEGGEVEASSAAALNRAKRTRARNSFTSAGGIVAVLDGNTGATTPRIFRSSSTSAWILNASNGARALLAFDGDAEEIEVEVGVGGRPPRSRVVSSPSPSPSPSPVHSIPCAHRRRCVAHASAIEARRTSPKDSSLWPSRAAATTRTRGGSCPAAKRLNKLGKSFLCARFPVAPRTISVRHSWRAWSFGGSGMTRQTRLGRRETRAMRRVARCPREALSR